MKGDNQTFQVKFWSLIGPFICLLTLFVFFVKGSQASSYLPVTLILGVPLCWKWKLSGMAAAVFAMVVLLGFNYSAIPLDERFWHLGMGISVAISLFITALAFEEVESIIGTLNVESRSRLENLWKVDEKLQNANEDLKKKKDRIRELNIKIRSYQKLLDHATEEIVELKSQLETVADENYQTEPAVSAEVEELKMELQEAKDLLAQYEKAGEERGLTELGDVESILEKHLTQMEEEAEKREQEHLQEIESLQETIASLLKKQ